MIKTPIAIAALIALAGPAISQAAPDQAQIQLQQQAAARAAAARRATAAALEPDASPSRQVDTGRVRPLSSNEEDAAAPRQPQGPYRNPFTGIHTPWEPR